MAPYPFIFSDELRYRLQRHFLFWASWWLMQTILYSFAPGLLGVNKAARFEFSAIDALLFLFPHMFLAYSLMYFMIPKILVKGKYALAVVVTILRLWKPCCRIRVLYEPIGLLSFLSRKSVLIRMS